MAKEKNKEVVEETTNKVEEPKKSKKSSITKVDMTKIVTEDDGIIKVDLSKQPEKENEEVKQEPVNEEDVIIVNEEPKEEIKEEAKEEQEDTPIVQEVTEEEVKEVQDKIEETITESEATGKPLPEKVEKLINFMEETGGDLNDYIKLNRDISKMDDSDILDEYYRETKSHLTSEERNFLLEEKFGYNEDDDDAKDIRKKKIALKEQVAEAKAHLDRQKSKYYEDIKAGSRLTPEAKKAMDFFNRYNKESKEQERKTNNSKKEFLKKTDSVFNKDFKGFDYQVGDRKFRFNVKDVNSVKTTQSDLNNFVDKFVGEDKVTIKDAEGYHKSLFTAMNADNIAKHFYEQGRADAIKERVAKDKNIDLNPRQTHGETNVEGIKYRVLGESSSDMKNRSFKIRKKN